MNKKINRIYIIFLLALLFQFVNAQSFDGFALYNSQGSNTAYLIDENQNIAHTWNMNTECNYTVALKKMVILLEVLKQIQMFLVMEI